MVGPRSPFPLRYLDEAIGFLVPRSQVSFPVPCPRPTFRSFIPPFFVPCSQIYHTSPPSEKEASHTLGIIYTKIFNTLVRGMPVLKTRNSLNLISTDRVARKTLEKLFTMRRGLSLVCLVRASFLSYVPSYLRDP